MKCSNEMYLCHSTYRMMLVVVIHLLKVKYKILKKKIGRNHVKAYSLRSIYFFKFSVFRLKLLSRLHCHNGNPELTNFV